MTSVINERARSRGARRIIRVRLHEATLPRQQVYLAFMRKGRGLPGQRETSSERP